MTTTSMSGALLGGLASLVVPPLLKAIGIGKGRGRRRMAAILGRGGVRGMKWGYRKCGKCGRARHRCAGRKKRGRRGRRRGNRPLPRHIRWN